MGRERLDLTGQRFGSLTVLGPVEPLGRKTAWRCRCDCGRETVVRTQHLRAGHTASCGCRRTERGVAALTYVDGTCVELLRAKTVRRSNTSGVPGVDWRASKQRWRASICFQGRRQVLGSFVHFEDAVAARKAAEAAIHDRFLREYAQSG